MGPYGPHGIDRESPTTDTSKTTNTSNLSDPNIYIYIYIYALLQSTGAPLELALVVLLALAPHMAPASLQALGTAAPPALRRAEERAPAKRKTISIYRGSLAVN